MFVIKQRSHFGVDLSRLYKLPKLSIDKSHVDFPVYQCYILPDITVIKPFYNTITGLVQHFAIALHWNMYWDPGINLESLLPPLSIWCSHSAKGPRPHPASM